MAAVVPLFQLAPITTRVIHRPAYYTRSAMSFGDWYARNEPAVTQYWDERQQFGPVPSSDYLDFCASQYDLAMIERTQRELEAQDDEG